MVGFQTETTGEWLRHPPGRPHPGEQVCWAVGGSARRPAASSRFQRRAGWTQLPKPRRALRNTTPRSASWSRAASDATGCSRSVWLSLSPATSMWQAHTQTVTAAQRSTRKLCPRRQTPAQRSLPLLPSVLRQDTLHHMTSLESAGVCSQPSPGLFLGVLLWLLLLTGWLSVCSSWRVWREPIRAEITPWQLDTLRLPGNVGAGRLKGQRSRE